MGVCVESCPTVSEPVTSTDPADYYCLSWFYDQYAGDSAGQTAYINDACLTNGEYDANLFCSCNIKRKSKSIFHRCVYTDGTASIDEGNPTADDYLKMWMSDIYTARNVIFGFGFIVALVFGFLYSYLMSISWIAYGLVWTSILMILALVIAMAAVAQNTKEAWDAEDPQEHTASQKAALQGFVYTLLCVIIIWFFVMLWMFNAINTAIKCVVMGATALDEMPIMVLFPILQVAGFILFLVPWTFYCMYIASMGEYEVEYRNVLVDPSNNTFQNLAVGRTWKTDSDANVNTKLWFMLFCLLWTMNFISNFGQLVMSHAVATWYFTEPAHRVETINNHTVWESMKLSLRFHLGTVAFGSLLIALIQFARAVALYIQRNTKKECRDLWWVKTVFCCINCCLCILECCMKFISKHAYIQTAIHGTAFCSSAKNVFALIARNIMRIGALVFTAELCLFIGKLFVTMLATATSYYWFNATMSDDLYDIVAPTIFVAILAWMTATMFMDVLHMTVDTILHCFISDEEHNNGTAVFATDSMKSFVDDHGKMDAPEEGAVEVPDKK